LQENFINPIILQRADPWIYKHSDGYYYFTASVPEYDRIEVRRAKSIQELDLALTAVVWKKHADGVLSKNIWAPEIHFVDGKWYIYFAAGREDSAFEHRIYVIECASENPLQGTWIEKGQVITKWDSFSLDATTFEHNGVRYLVWAQSDPEIQGNSNLYIAPMTNPWTIDISKQIMITTPEYDWEVIGYKVNEGAAVLKKNGKIFISFSASATDHNYCMGLLIADAASDLLNPDSWTKSTEPVFKTNYETSQFGPGHNSFTVSADGEDDILIYHARNYKEITVDPLYDPNRHVRAQKLNWDKDGMPLFGTPVPDSR
jgi:GH43 family beta-xylosidase